VSELSTVCIARSAFAKRLRGFNLARLRIP
jgi:hypothetical protein